MTEPSRKGSSELTELLARATQGDQAVQAELVKRVYPKLRSIVHRELERSVATRARNHNRSGERASNENVFADELCDNLEGACFPRIEIRVGQRLADPVYGDRKGVLLTAFRLDFSNVEFELRHASGATIGVER